MRVKDIKVTINKMNISEMNRLGKMAKGGGAKGNALLALAVHGIKSRKEVAKKMGKMEGRAGHEYDKDSLTGHVYAKRFGGAGTDGVKIKPSKHVLNLKKK